MLKHHRGFVHNITLPFIKYSNCLFTFNIYRDPTYYGAKLTFHMGCSCRIKGNLMGCYMECRYGDDGTFEPTEDDEYYSKMNYDKDELPDYRIPVSQYQDYEQTFQVV